MENQGKGAAQARKNSFVSQMTSAYFAPPSLDLRVQSFNLLDFAGFAAGLVIAVSSVVTDAGPANIALNLAASLAGADSAVPHGEKADKLSHRLMGCNHRSVYYFVPDSVFHGGRVPKRHALLLHVCNYFTAILLKNRELNAALALESALYAARRIVTYFHPETVTPFGSEFARVRDALVGITAASVPLTVAFTLHIPIYNDR